jgi:riboflavin synthase
MFTGIIETLGKVVSATAENSNLHLRIKASFTSELKIDQSVAHNGVCLTVVEIEGDEYVVTAIDETLKLSNIGDVASGDLINLERCMRLGDRLDGHWVQGHVDGVATVSSVNKEDGSWRYSFDHSEHDGLIVHKGSITINGVSLTVVEVTPSSFAVAIIPYTHEHTNFHSFKIGTKVNIEFDIFGKYVQARMR